MTTFMKRITTLMFALVLTMLAVGASPLKAMADVGDVDVTITNDGKLTINGGGMSSGGTSANAWNEFIKKYRGFIVGISGVAAVTMLLAFVFLWMKLGVTAGNSKARAEVTIGLVVTGLATAGLGATSIIVGFFYSALR